MDIDLRKAGQGAEHDVLDAGLHGRGQCNGITVTTQARVDPENVNDGFFVGHGNSQAKCSSVLRLGCASKKQSQCHCGGILSRACEL